MAYCALFALIAYALLLCHQNIVNGFTVHNTRIACDLIAQLVGHLSWNHKVVGSSPTADKSVFESWRSHTTLPWFKLTIIHSSFSQVKSFMFLWLTAHYLFLLLMPSCFVIKKEWMVLLSTTVTLTVLMAQKVEHLTSVREIVGSNPGADTSVCESLRTHTTTSDLDWPCHNFTLFHSLLFLSHTFSQMGLFMDTELVVRRVTVCMHVRRLRLRVFCC